MWINIPVSSPSAGGEKIRNKSGKLIESYKKMAMQLLVAGSLTLGSGWAYAFNKDESTQSLSKVAIAQEICETDTDSTCRDNIQEKVNFVTDERENSEGTKIVGKFDKNTGYFMSWTITRKNGTVISGTFYDTGTKASLINGTITSPDGKVTQ